MSDYGLHKNDKTHEIDRVVAADMASPTVSGDAYEFARGRVGEREKEEKEGRGISGSLLTLSTEWVVSPRPPRRPLHPTTMTTS